MLTFLGYLAIVCVVYVALLLWADGVFDKKRNRP
jgi:hypothetical protein